MLLDILHDVIRSVAHFRLCAHTLQIETVTWTHNTSPTCDLCNAHDRRWGTCDGKSIIHPRNLWVWGSNFTGGHNRLSCPRSADTALKP